MDNRIRLRALTKDDLDKTLSWHNQKEIRELYLGHPFPINKEMEELWYQKVLTSNYPVSVFGIEKVNEKELIGITLLKDINFINRSAEFAVYIGDNKFRGEGLAKEATIETLKFAFYELGLNRIYLKVLEINKVALHLYERIGFRQEGVLKEAVFKNNLFVNEIIMAILKKEFELRYGQL